MLVSRVLGDDHYKWMPRVKVGDGNGDVWLKLVWIVRATIVVDYNALLAKAFGKARDSGKCTDISAYSGASGRSSFGSSQLLSQSQPLWQIKPGSPLVVLLEKLQWFFWSLLFEEESDSNKHKWSSKILGKTYCVQIILNFKKYKRYYRLKC